MLLTKKMNFYGSTVGPQHTLFGRVAPMMEALRVAVCRAAEQPLPPVQLAHELPVWVHNIAAELTCTVFKGIVNLAPATKKYHARKNGQMVGLLIRMAIFYWKDAPATLEHEGLDKLTPAQAAKLEKLTGWKVACHQASKIAGRPITTKAQVMKFWRQRLGKLFLHTVRSAWKLIAHALHQPVGDVLEFLTGLPKGFKCFLRTDGEFAKTGKRTEIFMALLTYWPEIEEMRRAQPPLTRLLLLAWLEKQEGKVLSDHKIFAAICDDTSLDMAPPGHPFNQPARQM